MPDLLSHPLILVTGKGGTGKTTVARALAAAGRSEGLDAVVSDVAADDGSALREYLAKQLGSERLAAILTRSRAIEYLTAAAPGAREQTLISKVIDLTDKHDTVVADMPASGHAIGMLRVPRMLESISRVGPLARMSASIASTLEDPGQTVLVAVTLPSELPVSETLELTHRAEDQLGRPLDAIVVNDLLDERFSDEDVGRLDGHPATEAARREAARARMQHAQLQRLKDGTDVPVTTLPHVVEGDLIEVLAAELLSTMG